MNNVDHDNKYGVKTLRSIMTIPNRYIIKDNIKGEPEQKECE